MTESAIYPGRSIFYSLKIVIGSPTVVLLTHMNGTNSTKIPSSSDAARIGVEISKATGGASADVRKVIESELARINEEWSRTDKANTPRNNNSCQPE